MKTFIIKRSNWNGGHNFLFQFINWRTIFWVFLFSNMLKRDLMECTNRYKSYTQTFENKSLHRMCRTNSRQYTSTCLFKTHAFFLHSTHRRQYHLINNETQRKDISLAIHVVLMLLLLSQPYPFPSDFLDYCGKSLEVVREVHRVKCQPLNIRTNWCDTIVN